MNCKEDCGRRRPVYSCPLEANADYMNELFQRMRQDTPSREGLIADEEVDSSLPQPIEVVDCEFYCKDNAKPHHTENFDLVESKDPSPVLRRGQKFYMAIRFERTFDMDKDRVKLELLFGPKEKRGVSVILPITSAKSFTKDLSKWDIYASSQEKVILTLQIQIPYTAGVGLWRMNIISKVEGNDRPKTHKCKQNIYILFNPWIKDDPVYMEDDNSRKEYVLNDMGKLYDGTYKAPNARPWVFGQFAVLPACVYVLEKSALDYLSRGDPIKVTRALSAIVNANDDNGVVVGKWYEPYDKGVHPAHWTGSFAILEQYLKTGGQPVKYGQCWVFSAVCTTVCRALGIPCRSVVNFDSAHDTDDSLTIDIFLDVHGQEVKQYDKDSKWNYHVWNDCWMTRPDLPPGYGGWQTVDPSPQETSEGFFQSGPASVVAVRRGEVGYLYDTPFVYSEVNADVIYWQVDKDSDHGIRKLDKNITRIGTRIVTRKIGPYAERGNADMEDITLLYKAKEGTSEERMTIMKAASIMGLRFIYDIPEPEKQDVHFKLRDIEQVMIGKKFDVTVDIENKSEENRTVKSVLSVSSVYYTGTKGRHIKGAKETFNIKPGQKEKLSIEVTTDDYLDKLVEYSMVKIYVISTVKETGQTSTEEDEFQLQNPVLTTEVEGKPKVNETFNLKYSFTNPLKRALEECFLAIEGPGLAEPRKIPLDDVGPEMTMTHVEAVTPKKAGLRNMVGVFYSRQLIEVLGTKEVKVEE